MTIRTIEPEQHTAAKVAGFIYLVAMATSIFAELYLRGPLIVRDAMQTAINIAASERLFRNSSVIHLITVASDAVTRSGNMTGFSAAAVRDRSGPCAP